MERASAAAEARSITVAFLPLERFISNFWLPSFSEKITETERM